ncbi:hypothetical protein SO802_023423 [Lithocarpus litseifolius]|uniref:Protein FAR1-RELATED SEQUENCE n=1 Tax=Lithocarpus litseifolius TaxID=425828 RepID=A0AAW2CBN4_9ROSI
MKFGCDDSAYEFYKDYAHQIGFSVRKQFIKRGNMGQAIRRTFCYSKEGERGVDKRQEQVYFHRPISRVRCLAQMTCQLQKDDLLSLQVGGQENLGFLDYDNKSHVHRERRKALKKGDTRAVMEYFHNMQLEDPSYFYSVQVDDDGQILNIFWTDARSIVDYGHFGDVLCFDTTYRTNQYDQPFATFIGVNHHKQTIIFGAALLYDETIESFKCCMKFSLVGILCVHGLKVLDQENIKILPTHYIWKRWTQYAKVDSIKNYHGVDIKGDNGCQSHEDITFHDIRGIKTKPTIGRSKSRLKGVLERPRNPKSQRKKAYNYQVAPSTRFHEKQHVHGK